jgi:hypothetical protein
MRVNVADPPLVTRPARPTPTTLVVVWTVLVVVLVFVVVIAGAVLAARHALHRRNRVVRAVASPAPLVWLTSGRREAKMHRRLRDSGRRLELIPPTDDVVDLVARRRVELVELDAYLVTVARRPSRTRRADRPRLVERIVQIEDLVHRVEERSHNEPVSLTELSERLDLLEAADQELDELRPGETPR